MSHNFRCLRLYDIEKGQCISLSALLKTDGLKKGFHAFFCHSSIIFDYHKKRFDPVKITSAGQLKNYFKSEIKTLSLKNEDCFKPKAIYSLGHQPKPSGKFPRKGVIEFGRKLRATLGSNEPYNSSPGYALYQAIVYNLLNESYEGSPLYDTGGLYGEYLLWNDNNLWTKAEWTEQINSLPETFTLEENKQLRLAWLGSGWLSSRLGSLLEQNKDNYKNNPTPFPPEIEKWTKSGLSSLLEYDAVLIAYFQKKEMDVPDWKVFYNYINLLCDFLPYHLDRENPAAKEYVSSNSTGDRGGPRLWAGYLGSQMNMHLRHLILDSWITLWPVDDKLYYQPASLALLYWAAKNGNKPFTHTPKEFIENYQWDAAKTLWFGGHWIK